MCFGESDGYADIWEARGAGIREDLPPGSGSCDKVVMLVLLPENRRSEEVGIGESHLENSYVFFFFFVKNVITLLSLLKDSFTGSTVVGYQVNFLQCFDPSFQCLWLPWILLTSQLYLSCPFEGNVFSLITPSSPA